MRYSLCLAINYFSFSGWGIGYGGGVADETTYDLERELQQDEDAWRKNLSYWRKYAPEVHVNWEQNLHVDPRAIRTSWDSETMGLAPLVNMQVIPRKKPLPKKGFFSENGWIGSLAASLLVAVPYVGPVLALAVGIGTTVASVQDVKSWVKKMRRMPPSVFAPRYYPEPFTVPLPLDRAQYIADRPWLAPLMVDRFMVEWNAGQIGDLDAAVTAVLPTEEFQTAFGDLPSQRLTGLGSGDSPNVPRGTMPSSAKSSGWKGWLVLAGIGGVVVVWRKIVKKGR